jgi:preprotein translocase subunit SecG
VLLVLVLAVVVGTGTGRGFGSVLDGGDGELVLKGRKANTQSVLVME